MVFKQIISFVRYVMCDLVTGYVLLVISYSLRVGTLPTAVWQVLTFPAGWPVAKILHRRIFSRSIPLQAGPSLKMSTRHFFNAPSDVRYPMFDFRCSNFDFLKKTPGRISFVTHSWPYPDPGNLEESKQRTRWLTKGFWDNFFMNYYLHVDFRSVTRDSRRVKLEIEESIINELCLQY